MRTITHAEKVERARTHLHILGAKLDVAEAQAILAQAKATRAYEAARKAETAATCATNKARKLEDEVDRAVATLDALTK